MNWPALTRTLSRLQLADRPQPVASRAARDEPCIALIYGFASREHMQRHLLRFLRQSGFADTTMYGHLQAQRIADELQAAAAKGRRIAVIGFSQGGLEAVRVARELDRRGVRIDLLVTIAAGGRGGRFWPHRWHDDPRSIPANVACCLNYFSLADQLGTDHPVAGNLAVGVGREPRVENIAFGRDDRVSHLAITRCFPAAKLRPRVRDDLLPRLLAELSALRAAAEARS